MNKLTSIILLSFLLLATFLSIDSSAFAQNLRNSRSMLPSDAFTIAQAKLSKPRPVKVSTTKDFEAKHFAKDEKDALDKAKKRVDGGELLHYVRKEDIQNVDLAISRKFADALSQPTFVTPTPDILPNNYWIDGSFPVWEYSKLTGKITRIKEAKLCLGLIQFFLNPNTGKVEIGIHHIQKIAYR